MTAARRRPDAGFTLLEVLAALVVFGFLIAGLAESVRFGLAAYRTQSTLIARENDLDTTDRLLSSLLAVAQPAALDADQGFVGTAHGLVFTTTLPALIGDPATDEADARLSVNHGRFVLALVPYYHATRLAPDTASPTTVTLADGVADATFSYWDDASHDWFATWRSNLPPGLVRITVHFHGRRHWPPLVVRPVLSPFNG